jgi:hypothetical protein
MQAFRRHEELDTALLVEGAELDRGHRRFGTASIATLCFFAGAGTAIAASRVFAPPVAPAMVEAQGGGATVEAQTTAWYEGIPNILVNPTTFPVYTQFDTRRALVLLTEDAPTLDVQVGFYTQVVGATEKLTTVNSISAPSTTPGGSTQTFMRAAERLSVTGASTWSVSQGCSLRNSEFAAGLQLSAGSSDWGSGGFISDISVSGTFDTGIQQQWITKSSTIGSLTTSASSWNLLFVGVDGATQPTGDSSRYVTVVPETAGGARKPYVQMDSAGAWVVVVPAEQGPRTGYDPSPPLRETIPIDDCTIWSVPAPSASGPGTKGFHAASLPASTDATCVIIAPGVYNLSSPVVLSGKGAVVVGLGFATFQCATSEPCLVVQGEGASVSGLVVDAAFTDLSKPTGALVEVTGAGSRLYDIYCRVIALPALVRADVLLHIVGNGVILENTWLWHADHDPWPKPADELGTEYMLVKGSHNYEHTDIATQNRMLREAKERVASRHGVGDAALSLPYLTDSCVSHHALVVDGSNFIVYGLMAEHTHWDIVVWNGEYGQTFLLQCEVPYYVMGPDTWGPSRLAYRVNALLHSAVGLGAYVTNPSWVGAYTPFTEAFMMSFQATNTLNKVFGWINPSGSNSYTNVFNTSSGFILPLANCAADGGLLDGTACYWDKALPPAPPVGPMPPPSPPHPPNPPNPPPPPPAPPASPPPKDVVCYVDGANGGNLGTKVAQSSTDLTTVADCANFCRSAGAAWFIAYSLPGTCFCYNDPGRAFPGVCYSQPGGYYGTTMSDCSPAKTTCSSSS